MMTPQNYPGRLPDDSPLRPALTVVLLCANAALFFFLLRDPLLALINAAFFTVFYFLFFTPWNRGGGKLHTVWAPGATLWSLIIGWGIAALFDRPDFAIVWMIFALCHMSYTYGPLSERRRRKSRTAKDIGV